MKKFNILLADTVNDIITVVVATGLTYNDPANWFQYLYGSFIFSNCIGFAIYGLVHLVTRRISRYPIVLRLVLMFVLFLFGGFVGTEASIGILFVLTGFSYDTTAHIQMLLFNSVLAEAFGSSAVLYFSLRARAERLVRTARSKRLSRRFRRRYSRKRRFRVRREF